MATVGAQPLMIILHSSAASPASRASSTGRVVGGQRAAWITAAAVVLLLFAPVAAAYALTAELEPEHPFAATGAVAMDAADARAFAYFVFSAPGPAQTVLTSDYAQVIITTFTESPLKGTVAANLWTAAGLEEKVETFDVHQATLRLDAIEKNPQAALFRQTPAERTLDVVAAGAHCLIDREGLHEPVEFPQDSARLSNAGSFSPQDTNLRAECDAVGARAMAPAGTLLYGLDLFLSSTEESRSIRTGTFVEPDETGVGVHTVTRWLRVNARDESLRVTFELPLHVKMFAQRLLVVGELEAGPSRGHLTWSDVVRDGSIDPFSATGEFSVEGQASPAMAVEGSTINGPNLASAQGVAGLSGAVAWGAVAAGLGLVALASWLLWGLFARLRGGRVLEHPRRQRILELVRTEPGIPAGAVGRRLNIPWTKTMFHVRALAANGHLLVRRFDGRTALFLPGAATGPTAEQLALRRRPALMAVLGAVSREPGVGQRGLCERLELRQSRISKALNRLQRAGLVVARRENARLTYYAANDPAAIRPNPPP